MRLVKDLEKNSGIEKLWLFTLKRLWIKIIILEVYEIMSGICEDRLAASVLPAAMNSVSVSEIKKWKK